MTTGVVADRALLVGGHVVELGKDLLDRDVSPLGSLKRGIGVLHIRRVMLVVMDLHRVSVDVGLERIEGVGERRKGVGHAYLL
jgi:hypothetical protein